MIARRGSLLAIAGLVSGIWLAGSFISVPLAAAQTKTEIKQKGREAAKKAYTDWNSLTPEQQQKLAEKWHVSAEQAQEKWNSMTPEQQQQAAAQAKTTVQQARKKWQSLPQ